MTEIVQVQLTSGTERLTCYVPTKPTFKVGDQITLRDSESPEQLWSVEWRAPEPIESGSLPRRWDPDLHR